MCLFDNVQETGEHVKSINWYIDKIWTLWQFNINLAFYVLWLATLLTIYSVVDSE